MYLFIGIVLIAVGFFLVQKKNKTEQLGQEVQTCPRCLGKGHVDEHDIVRLNRMADWLPDKCMYCNGKGKVMNKIKESVAVDEVYLNTNLDEAARKRFIAGHPEELRKAEWFKYGVDKLKQSVIEMRKLQQLSADEIAKELIRQHGYPETDREILVIWIERIIDVENLS